MAIKKKEENEVSAVLTPIRYNQGQTGVQPTGQGSAGQFYSPYTAQKNQALDAYLNRDAFKYDINTDALYQHYKNKYIQQGQQAMQDTMGQAAALTGGYGSSYAQNVGQQAYNQHLTQLNDIVPELYQLAYSKYQDKGNELLQRYGLLADEESQDYSRWYQTERDAVEDQRYADDDAKERALALAYAGDYSGIAEVYGMTDEQAAAYAMANGMTSMTEEKAMAMAMTGDYSGIATLYGMSNDQAKAWAQANGITPETLSTSKMTEEQAMVMAANGDYSGIAQWLSVPVDYAKAWYIKEYGDPTAEEPIEKPIYSRRDPETGNYIYYYGGKEVEFEKGVNPITGKANPDGVGMNEDGSYRVFLDSNGNPTYQPNNIGGVPLEKAGWTDTINGHEQNVWEKTSDGSLWMWDDTKNAYVEYDKPVAVDTDGVKRFEQTLYDDYGYRTASEKSKKGIAKNRIEEWLNSGRIDDDEAATLIAKYVL